MIVCGHVIRLLGLALIAVLTAGLVGPSAETTASHPCHERLNGCLVCEASKPDGGTCTVEICGRDVETDCFDEEDDEPR